MFTEEIQSKILDASEKLSEALNAQRLAAKEWAMTAHAYRQAQAAARIGLTEAKRSDGKYLTEGDKDARVDQMCSAEMRMARMAEAMTVVEDDLVKSLRAQISALQSLLSANKAEVEALRYGQGVGA